MKQWKVRSWQYVLDGKLRRATTQKPRQVRLEVTVEAESRKSAIQKFLKLYPDEYPLMDMSGPRIHIYAWPDEPRKVKPKPDVEVLPENPLSEPKRKPGRPKRRGWDKDAPRVKTIGVRVSEQTYKQLAELGEESGKKPATIASEILVTGLLKKMLDRDDIKRQLEEPLPAPARERVESWKQESQRELDLFTFHIWNGQGRVWSPAIRDYVDGLSDPRIITLIERRTEAGEFIDVDELERQLEHGKTVKY